MFNTRAVIISAFALLLGFTAALPTQQTPPPSTVPEAISTPTASLSTPHLENRQAVTAAPVPLVPGQVSPVTTLQIGYVKNGAYTVITEIYSQAFVLPLDQWPTATAGSIGLGTIVGVVGNVKSKRDVMPVETQLPTPQREQLTLESLREMMGRPIEDKTSTLKMDLVLTTEALNLLMAELSVEAADGEKKRNVVLTTELLDKLMAALPVGDGSKAKREVLTTEELDTIMAALPAENDI